MTKFDKGIDYWEGEQSNYKTFGIDNIEESYGNQIEIYGDLELRDLIIRLLNNYYDIVEERTGKTTKCNICLQEIPDAQFADHVFEHVDKSKNNLIEGKEVN
jgi:hypothetical protein